MSNPIRLLITSIEYLVRYEAGSKLAGVIYIYRISDRRFTGIDKRNLKMFRELCGDETLKNIILVTNMWGEVTQAVGESREQRLITDFFKPILDKGAQIARHHNTAESAHDIIRRIMKNQPAPLQIQRELVDEHKDITDTAAGEAVNEELREQIRRHKAELKTVQEEMKQAFEDKDEETRKELEEKSRELQEQMKKKKEDSEGMGQNYQAEKMRMDEIIKEMREQARLERERADALHKKEMELLDARLQDIANESAARRQEMQQRIDQLQHQWDNRPREGGGCLIM